MSQLQDVYSCPMKLTMDLIGGKWKITILWYLNDGTKRFGEIKESPPDTILSFTRRRLSISASIKLFV